MKKYVLIFCLVPVYSLFAQVQSDRTTSLFPENIIKLTFENSDRIKAAYYKLEAAKYNFKLFESEYTQFNPLIVDSKVQSNSNGEYFGDFSTGMSKEFFDGTSISTSGKLKTLSALADF